MTQWIATTPAASRFNIASWPVATALAAMSIAAMSIVAISIVAAPLGPTSLVAAEIEPLVRVVDLDVGESTELELCDGRRVRVELVALRERHDTVCNAVRRAEVTVRVNGQEGRLVSATYHLPQVLGGAQIDCSVTKGYNADGSPEFWGLDKDARLRLWPAESPWIRPGTFRYPVLQKWFASDTQMANDPVFVDGGDQPGRRKIYYHSGLDIGGSEGLTPVVAATDALIVSVGEQVLEGHRRDTPVSPRYDVVYLLDSRGWYYRYSHLKTIDSSLAPGRTIPMGHPIGILGKEGGSGGWSHLHFEIKSRQPSGKWGTQEGYAFLWESYVRERRPERIAVARPHQIVWSGDAATLDGSRSWAAGKIASYEWLFSDGATALGPQVSRKYERPGRYSEALKITDAGGGVSYDFAVVVVADKQHPERRTPSIHANYYPTSGVRAGDEITFKCRTFNTEDASQLERWDFGDGSPEVAVRSDGNAVKLAPDGYAQTTHRYEQPGDYLVRVTRNNEHGVPATAQLHVNVAAVAPRQDSGKERPARREAPAWESLAPHFTPPESWAGKFGDYRSPLVNFQGDPIATAEQWRKHRPELLRQWQELLGPWPPLFTKPQFAVLETTRPAGETFRQLKIRFRWTPNEWTTGYLLIPDGEGRRPAVITVFYEPLTALGRGASPHRDFAIQLARRGFVALSLGTTEASQSGVYALYHPRIDAPDVAPLSMLGCAAANAWHLLANREEVDSQRIGIVGHSFGGKWAMFASCLFDKFACAAWSDPGIVFDESRGSVNYWEPWYLGDHPRPWRKRGLITPQNPAFGRYTELVRQGRDLHELHALMAPRPFLVSGGSEDPPRRWEALNHTIAVNRVLGFSERVGMTNRPDHSPNPESNAVLYAFFEHFLMEQP